MAQHGMLVVWTDVDRSEEATFERWYEREHLSERVGHPGWLWARRYRADSGPRPYIALYLTDSPAALASPVYQAALANPTPLSRTMTAAMRDMLRVIGTVTIDLGAGLAGNIMALRLQPGPRRSELRTRLASETLPELLAHDGVVAARLVEADPERSVPLGAPAGTPPFDDWILLVEATSPAVLAALEPRLRHVVRVIEPVGSFRFLSAR